MTNKVTGVLSELFNYSIICESKEEKGAIASSLYPIMQKHDCELFGYATAAEFGKVFAGYSSVDYPVLRVERPSNTSNLRLYHYHYTSAQSNGGAMSGKQALAIIKGHRLSQLYE